MPARPHTDPRPRHSPEKAVQTEIRRFLRALGYHVSDFSQPRASMQTAGVPTDR